jgi:hypothetical protein
MSIPLDINGTEYQYPEVNDVSWGPDATDWAVAVTTGMLQKAGGLFQLLSEVDFGSGFGLKSICFKSRSPDVSSAGIIRLSAEESIGWRNAANDGDLLLSVGASNELLFNGASIGAIASVVDTATIDLTLSGTSLSADIVAQSIDNALISASAGIEYSKLDLAGSIVDGDMVPGTLTNASVSDSAGIVYSKLDLSDSIVNSDIASSAAIAHSKLAALTASRALVSDGSGIVTPSSVTSTELDYLSGATANIQGQLDVKQPLDSDLSALAALSGTGLLARTGSASYSERTLTGTTNQIVVTNGNGVSGNPVLALASNPVLPGTASVVLPVGTTAERPTGANGMIRFNTSLNVPEFAIGTSWFSVGSATPIYFRGTTNVTTAISGTPATIPFTVEVDTNSAWSVDTYTVPANGMYQVDAYIQTAAYNISTSQVLYLVIQKNGTDYAYGLRQLGNGVSIIRSCGASSTVSCNAGDTIRVQVATDVATTIRNAAAVNYISIVKVG